MDQNRRYRSYGSYLQERYGERAFRVAVDAGFSCPNRGTDRNRPGCLYCEGTGSRAPYLGDRESLREQVDAGIRFLRHRYRARTFLLYFQAFSSTFAPVGTLKDIYDRTLAFADFRELIVSTRPDCIDAERADLLASYRTPERDVWVELGLQSACDETLRRIRRGHGVAEFLSAFRQLRERGIRIAVHLIFGLPGEGRREILETVRLVASLVPDGVKIHNLHVPADTPLHRELLSGEITVPSPQRHLSYTADALELLPRQTVVMRLTCDTPAGRRVLPQRFWDKQEFARRLDRELELRGSFQGSGFPSDREPPAADTSRRCP